MNIILIGFMGSGKTSIGIRLSYKMKQPFLDTDKEIERLQNRKISEIFQSEGEEAFRRMETEYIEELLNRKIDDHIISVGGGTPLRPENAEILKRLGVVVWLKVSPETVYSRIKGDNTRPLLMTEDPEATIRELIGFRDPLYRKCSDMIITVDDKPTERIMDEIFTRLPAIRRKKKRRKYEDTYNKRPQSEFPGNQGKECVRNRELRSSAGDHSSEE